mmetsp:Transcript_2885/g.6800  ORF Transcript_2885/g.6800 Transcript_2885/m.6800 type:complete len:102 (+) Transcript_2885:2836-3141(+)
MFGLDIKTVSLVSGFTQYTSTRAPEEFMILIPLDVLLLVVGPAETRKTERSANATRQRAFDIRIIVVVSLGCCIKWYWNSCKRQILHKNSCVKSDAVQNNK